MKYCPKCNKLAFDNETSCSACGTSLNLISTAGNLDQLADPKAGADTPSPTPSPSGDSTDNRDRISHMGLEELRNLVTQAA